MSNSRLDWVRDADLSLEEFRALFYRREYQTGLVIVERLDPSQLLLSDGCSILKVSEHDPVFDDRGVFPELPATIGETVMVMGPASPQQGRRPFENGRLAKLWEQPAGTVLRPSPYSARAKDGNEVRVFYGQPDGLDPYVVWLSRTYLSLVPLDKPEVEDFCYANAGPHTVVQVSYQDEKLAAIMPIQANESFRWESLLGMRTLW